MRVYRIVGWSGLCALAVLGCGQAAPAQGDDAASIGLALDTTGPCAITYQLGGSGIGGGAPSEVVIFRDGQTLGTGGSAPIYSGTTDTQLEQALPTTNEGTVNEIVIKGGANKRHALIRWDLSYLAPNTVVQNACITFQLQDPSAQAYPAFELLRSWSESQATWNTATTGTPWQTAGAWGIADSGSVIVGSIAPNSSGQVSIALAKELVQRWVSHPEQNYGVVLGNNSSNDGLSFASSEGSVSERPALLVQK